MAMPDLLALMARLRDPEHGCPWDVQQTFRTIAPYTLEEAYEVVDAIERNDLGALRGELGDLLLQVVFHAQMASEAGAFALFTAAAAQGHPEAMYFLGNCYSTGAGVALESAGVVLVHRDLRRIPTFLALSRLAMGRIRQNLGWALIYNALLVPLALAGRIHPILAATAMMASSISVVVNSSRKLSLDSRQRDLETT